MSSERGKSGNISCPSSILLQLPIVLPKSLGKFRGKVAVASMQQARSFRMFPWCLKLFRPITLEQLEETAGLAAKEEGGEDGILELQGGASDVQAEAGGLDKCTITSPRGDWAAKWSTRKPRSNRDCRWSWSERTCVPEDMCHYKYQVILKCWAGVKLTSKEA